MIDAAVVRTEPPVWVSVLGGAADGDDWLVEELIATSLVVASVGEGITVVNAVATATGAED
jgi:hypothetical protein